MEGGHSPTHAAAATYLSFIIAAGLLSLEPTRLVRMAQGEGPGGMKCLKLPPE